MKAQTEEVAKALSEQAHYVLEPIYIPTNAMAQACKNMNTIDRVMYAYDKCTELMEDETAYTETLAKAFSDSPSVVASKLKMHKQACNALFCNPKDRVNEDIGKPQLCMDAGDAEITYDDTDVVKEAPYTMSGIMSVIKSASRGAQLGFFIITLVLFIIFFKLILWPYVLWPLVVFLHNNVFMKRGGIKWRYFKDKVEEAKEAIVAETILNAQKKMESSN
jgi:hypothetical protein